jgi:diadenosine tetraphosphate (Ap4A) HIT family hydrolase
MIDIFDPLSIFKNALNHKSECLFCSPISGMTLSETENFRVLLDNFPICPGHIMISTKAHYGSAGEVPLELQQEFIELKNQIGILAKSKTGKVVFYEHGRAGSCHHANPNEQCDHFHLHCLPLDICIHKQLRSSYERIQMNQYSQIHDLFYEYGNYLFFENAENQMSFYVEGENKVASHLLRTLICSAIGKDNLANWEQYTNMNMSLYSQSFEYTKDWRETVERKVDLKLCA